jgi:hypothetical protein
MPRCAPNKMPPEVKRRYFGRIRSGLSGSRASQRAGLPFGQFFEHPVGDTADQVRGDVHVIHLAQVLPDVAGRHAPRIQGAWLLVVSSALIAAKDTLNWLTGVQDECGEKPKYAVPLAALAALRTTAGVGIFVVGVLKAL